MRPVSAPVVYADVFRARQLYDKLCARHLGVGAKRLGAQHRAALHLLVCAVCAFEHFCRCAFRPLEQKDHHAHLRCRGGAHHRRRARFAQHRCALRVVRGRGARLAAHSADERQLRCAVPHPHSREDAGPRLRRAQFAAIFHHSAWVSPCWRARRYRLRAVHGSVNTRKSFLLPVRHRQRLWRRVFVPCPRLPRRRRLPLLPPQQAYPRAGSERQRLKS